MSFFSKFFKSQPKDDFVLHSIQFATPESEHLTDGDYLWATIDFESRYDCQIWMLPQAKEDESSINYGYMPSDVFPAGRHSIERYFYLNDIDGEKYPNGITVNGANINVQTTDGGTLYNEMHDINYIYKALSADELAKRKNVDKENLKFEFISARYNGHILSPNDSISINSCIELRIQAQCNENVRFSCIPITDLDFDFYPSRGTTPDGLSDLTFSMNEVGLISGFKIVASNRYHLKIDSLQVDFPLKVEDWHDDGKYQPIQFEFEGIYDSVENDEGYFDIISESSILPHDKDFNLFMYLNHQAKHGVIVWIYDMVDGEIGEQILTSVLQTYDECQEEDYNPNFIINWEDVDFSENPIREVSGFYLQLTNVAGDVLAEESVDFALTIQGESE